MNVLNTSEKDRLVFCVFIEHGPSPGSYKNGHFWRPRAADPQMPSNFLELPPTFTLFVRLCSRDASATLLYRLYLQQEECLCTGYSQNICATSPPPPARACGRMFTLEKKSKRQAGADAQGQEGARTARICGAGLRMHVCGTRLLLADSAVALIHTYIYIYIYIYIGAFCCL
jgi:hypothetical protein